MRPARWSTPGHRARRRARRLSPQQIADRLDDRFCLLTTGGRTAPVRQQTLRAAIDWSYELLSEPEQRVFCRMSAFAGGATLDLIEEVCSGNGVDRLQVLDIVGRLVDKSLLVPATTREAQVRYTVLETLRHYGQEQLSVRGELAATRDRHANALLVLAERADQALRGPDAEWWLDRLQIEHDNLTALDWLVQGHDVERSRRLGGALIEFWHARGHLLDGRTLLSRILALGLRDRSVSRARVLIGAALMTDYLGDFEAARPLYDEALAVGRAQDDGGLVADCLSRLSELAELAGQYEQATRLLDEMLELSRKCGDRWHEATSLTGLGSIALALGDCARASSLLHQALAIFDVLGDRRAVARVRRTLSVVALQQGDDAVAETLGRQTLEVFRALGDPIGQGSCLAVLGAVATRRRNFVAARELFVECLRMRLELRDEDGVTWSLRGFAVLAAEEGHVEQALRLSGAATALRERLGAAFPGYAEWRERLFEQARSALPPAVIEAPWAAGRAMDRDAAVADAFSVPAAVAKPCCGIAQGARA